MTHISPPQAASERAADLEPDLEPDLMPDRTRECNAEPTPDLALEREVATLMIEALNLDTTPATIDPAAPLYGDGLGLDSIDILEVALVVSKQYGFQLRSDDDDNARIFSSLRSLAAHVARHRSA